VSDRLSVRLSVPSIDRATAASGFAAELPAGRRYRSIAAGVLPALCCDTAAGAQQQMRTASR